MWSIVSSQFNWTRLRKFLTNIAFETPIQKRHTSQLVIHSNPGISPTKLAMPSKLPQLRGHFVMSLFKEWLFSLKKSSSINPQKKMHSHEISSVVSQGKSLSRCNKELKMDSWTGVLVYFLPCTLVRCNQAVCISSFIISCR